MTAYREYFNPGTGEWIQYLVTGKESDGELARYRWRSVAGGSIPVHFHPRREERFQIEWTPPQARRRYRCREVAIL